MIPFMNCKIIRIRFRNFFSCGKVLHSEKWKKGGNIFLFRPLAYGIHFKFHGIMEIVCFVIGLAVGLAVGYLFFRQMKKQYEALGREREKRHEESVRDMKAAFAETMEHLKANLKASTEELLKSRQEELVHANRTDMRGIVVPLNETMVRLKEAMDRYTRAQNEYSGSMKENIDTIVRQTESARKSAEELTTALKHDSKMQGDYGEVILDELLARQGFTKGVHYELQYVEREADGRERKDADGRGLRPDVVVHLDDRRDVIVDSKMNITDFIAYANARTPEERRTHLERHVRSMENQVKLLSQKNYFRYHDKTRTRMDFVIMFVPVSAAWREALRFKPDLWREAMESNVYIADEQTLFAALRIIRLTWTQIDQVANQQKIFDLANEMIDRVGQFMKSYAAIGKSLDDARAAYDAGNRKLSPGGQSILTTGQKLLKLGAQDSRKHPVSVFLDAENAEPFPASEERGK